MVYVCAKFHNFWRSAAEIRGGVRIKCLAKGYYCHCQQIWIGDLTIESLWSYPLSQLLKQEKLLNTAFNPSASGSIKQKQRVKAIIVIFLEINKFWSWPLKVTPPSLKPEIRLHAKEPSFECMSQSDERKNYFGTRSCVHAHQVSA